MEYKKIERLVYNQNLINPQDFYSRKDYQLKLDKMLIDNLAKCVEKQVPLEMDELDYVKFYKTWLKLIKNNDNIDRELIFKVANLSTKKLDYLGIIQEITE